MRPASACCAAALPPLCCHVRGTACNALGLIFALHATRSGALRSRPAPPRARQASGKGNYVATLDKHTLHLWSAARPEQRIALHATKRLTVCARGPGRPIWHPARE